MTRLDVIRYAILCGMVIFGCALGSVRCTPSEVQRNVVAVHAYAQDLTEYCDPDATVRTCIGHLLELGATSIELGPRDGGR